MLPPSGVSFNPRDLATINGVDVPGYGLQTLCTFLTLERRRGQGSVLWPVLLQVFSRKRMRRERYLLQLAWLDSPGSPQAVLTICCPEAGVVILYQ